MICRPASLAAVALTARTFQGSPAAVVLAQATAPPVGARTSHLRRA